MIKKNIRYLMLAAIMLAVGSGAWATELYFWGYNHNSPQKGDGNATVAAAQMTKDGSTYTRSITFTGDYCFFISTNSSTSQSTAYDAFVTATSGADNTAPYYLLNGGYGQFNNGNNIYHIWSGGGEVTVTATLTIVKSGDNYAFSIGSAGAEYTITTSGDNCSFSPSSYDISSSGSHTFTVTPSSGYKLVSASVTNADIDKEDLENSTDPVDIVISNPTADGTLTVITALVDDPDAPIVYFGGKPVQSGAANVTVNGYLADRKCKTVTATGFYWGTSISDCTGHTHTFTTATNPAVSENGKTFSKLYDFSSDITTGTNLYFQAYVTTNDGSDHTGYSDVVGFFFNPCNGISSVTVEPSSVQLPDGESVTLQAIARGAGKNSTYVWKEGETVLQSGYSSSYTYTKTSGDHNLTVTVDDSTAEDGCGTSRTSSAVAVTDCDMPEFSLPENMETSPWMATAIEVSDGANFTDYKWSVTPTNAKLTDADESGATFRADALSDAGTTYTVSFTAIGDCTGADIEVTKTVEVTVKKDEGCK